MLAEFMQRLEVASGRFAWTCTSDGIRGYAVGGRRFCPVTAVLFAETGQYLKPWQVLVDDARTGLTPTELNLVVDASDTAHFSPEAPEIRAQLLKVLGLAS
jgi:hypothetical protein